MNVYPMTISSFKDDNFEFKDGDLIRRLICPPSRKKQISKCGKYYNFSKKTHIRYNILVFKFTKIQNTNSCFAKRLWDSLWEEGWREWRQ
jgi:hypothetical protein